VVDQEFLKMKKFCDACKIIKNSVSISRKNEYVNIQKSSLRVLATDYKSKFDSPRMDLSSMDGAVILKKDEKKKKFKIVGESKAGNFFSKDFKSGQAKLIYTGAPIPGKNKIVVPKENFQIQTSGKEIFINKIPKENFIRKKGLDFKKKQVCLHKQDILTFRSISLAKTMKIKKILVKRKPRINIILTGDELKSKTNKKGLIESSNEILLKFLATKLGGEILNISTTTDNENELIKSFNKTNDFDILITSGGISRGKYDIVKKALGKKGLKILFDRVAIKPGKPTTFGKFNKTKFFLGLPGNPVSCFITMLLFFPIYINSFYGFEYIKLSQEKLITKNDINNNNKLTSFLRIKLDNKSRKHFQVFDNQDSSLQKILNESDGILMRKPYSRSSKSGQSLDVILYQNILNNEI